jgi:hypothetical protein
MPDVIVTPERFASFVEDNGKPTQRGAEYMESLTRQVNASVTDAAALNNTVTALSATVTQYAVKSGSGSPEGVLTAEPTVMYMDTAGGAGTILYIKQTGSGNTGWILV